MARTPLLRALQRLVFDYRTAQAHNLSLAALRERRCEARPIAARRENWPFALKITRRQFLLGSAAAVAGLALPGTVLAGKHPHIAIVGGGIAGLNCALGLADHGIASTVYEASGRLGGRMFSNTSGYWQDGQVSEWCGELIDTGHTTIRKLAKRFGLALDNLLAAQAPGSEDTYYFDGTYYPQTHAATDFAAIMDALKADVQAAPFPTTFAVFTPTGRALDQMSIADWIASRVPGGIRSSLGQLLNAAYTAEYGADSAEQSALNLVYLLSSQPETGGLSLFGESDERFHIRGGNDQLPQAIAKHLSMEKTIRLDHRLVRIRQTPTGRYSLAFEHRQGTATEIVADYVVLALPFAVLREVDYAGAGFDPLKQRAIRELGCGHNGKLQLQFTQRVWRKPGPWPGIGTGSSYSDTGYQSSWEVTRAQPGGSGILNFYSGGAVTDAMQTTVAFAIKHPQVTQDAQTALDRATTVFPGLAAVWNGKATQSLPHKSSYCGASYAFYRVGQYTAFGGYEKQQQGGVFFCGEHTSTEFQGYMEGGASEGRRVAREIAARMARVPGLHGGGRLRRQAGG